MRRWIDLAVAALFVTTVVVTVRSLRTEESPPPPSPAPEAPTVPPGPTPQEIAHAQHQQEREEYERRRQEQAEWKASLQREDEELMAERERLDAEFRQNAARSSESSWQPTQSNQLPPLGSTGGSSEADNKRMEGRRQIAQVFSSMTGDARALVLALDTHMKVCGDQRGGQCDASLRNVGRLAIVVGRKLHAVHEIARTSWIPPGEVRELRERAGMDDVFWDRLVRIVNQYAR